MRSLETKKQNGLGTYFARGKLASLGTLLKKMMQAFQRYLEFLLINLLSVITPQPRKLLTSLTDFQKREYLFWATHL